MHVIDGALLSAVTWAASLFRPDPATGQWWVSDQVADPQSLRQPGPGAVAPPLAPAPDSQPAPESSERPAGEAVRGNGADPDPNWNPL